MFELIHDNSITLIDQSNKSLTSIPNGHAMLVVHRFNKMLEWLYDEFIDDVKNVASKIKNPIYYNGFEIRNISRNLTYVNHIYLIEGILRRAYSDMIADFKKYGITGIHEDAKALTDRESEVSSIMEFRHTVAAHTSYAKPHQTKDDDITPFRSLDALLMTGYNKDDLTSFIINAGERMTLDGRFSKRKIPSIGIYDLQQMMQKHNQAWTKMFVDKLKQAHLQLPIKKSGYELFKR